MFTEEELKAAIAKAVSDETAGLKSKNEELIGKLKKTSDALLKFEGIDIVALSAAKQELDEIKKKGDEERGEYKKLYETTVSEKSRIENELNAKIKDLSGNIVNMTKRNAVVAAIFENKITIPGPLMNMAIDSIMANVAVDDSGAAKVGDKSVSEFIKDWASSDIGKHLVASGNSGGGSNGGGDGNFESESKYFDKKSPHYSLTEQARLAKSNVDLYNRLKKQYS